MEGVEEQGSVILAPELQPKAHHYVVGLLFSEDSQFVLLVQKKRPEWQNGYHNGLGGKIEPGETPLAAMRRECIEEAGVDPEWSEFACVEYQGCILHFFAARDEAAFIGARPGTDEELIRFPLDWTAWSAKLIPNLTWLIPMGRHHVFYEKVALAHILMTGGGATIARKM